MEGTPIYLLRHFISFFANGNFITDWFGICGKGTLLIFKKIGHLVKETRKNIQNLRASDYEPDIARDETILDLPE